MRPGETGRSSRRQLHWLQGGLCLILLLFVSLKIKLLTRKCKKIKMVYNPNTP